MIGNTMETRRPPGAAAELESHVQVTGATHFYSAAGRDVVRVGPFALEVRRREFFSVVGPHGCGKSTLLGMVAGLLPVAAGKVEISGNAIESVLTDVGILFSDPALLGWRTVMGNVMLQAELRGLDLRPCAERAGLLIASMGLSGIEDRKPHELAPGLAQRVAICRALVHAPELLLSDDPFQFLDPLTREQIAMDLQRLWIREPITVLHATSQIEEAVQLSHKVAVMSADGSGIVETICIDLPHPRRMDKATASRIVEYSNRIRTIFHSLGLFP